MAASRDASEALRIRALPSLLLLGLPLGLLEWPYQLLSELGFRLQQSLWNLTGLVAQRSAPWSPASPWHGPLLVFTASAAMVWLAWGPLSAGRGGGVTGLLALDRAGAEAKPSDRAVWSGKLAPGCQLTRLPLLLLTHLAGLSVGVESPCAALGASLLLGVRRWRPLSDLPPRLVAVIGGAAGLGAAFRSPLLGVVYGLEELGRRSGLPLVPPVLLLAGSGSLVASTLGQPARLSGLTLGPLPSSLLGWAALLCLAGVLLGSLLVRLLIAVSSPLERWIPRHRLLLALLLAALLTLIAVASDGLSLNDGSLSLAAALRGQSGGGTELLFWRLLATVLSVAAGAPGGIMHDAMTLGGLLVEPLRPLLQVPPAQLAQLAAIAATALFAAANGTPIFCAVFVFTLQGDPASLPLLLLVSGVSAQLAIPLRGEEWNAHQAARLWS